eukprot:4662942-Alexandrium_andersonii.AAC.1
MSASLVGSEMCIRDRCEGLSALEHLANHSTLARHLDVASKTPELHGLAPVSYTHLTLPTICSV